VRVHNPRDIGVTDADPGADMKTGDESTLDKTDTKLIFLLHAVLSFSLADALTRISHQVSSRGGADGRGYKARDEAPRRHT
jgi:hypothetical protein